MSDAYDEGPIENSSSDHNLIDPELQVRLMNLVMGEASDFERDQLQLLMEQRPELAAYYKHLEHLHGLLSEVGAGEPTIDVDSATDDAEWRLPADRRERVLAVLENRGSELPPKVTLANQRSFINWRITTMEAIVVASVACVILGLMLPATQPAREAARRFGLRGGTDLSYRTSDMVPLAAPAKRGAGDSSLNAILSVTDSASPSAVTTDLYSHPGSFAGNEITRELAVVKDNTESMSIANGSGVPGRTLPSPHYLSDDVQYLPAGPEKKVASDPQGLGTLESLAEQKRGRTSGEKQLGEGNFGRPVVDGEDRMARRSTTAAVASEVNAPSLPGGTTSVLDTFGVTPPKVAVGQSGGVAGAAAPLFTTNLDFQIRNNFGVTPAFGTPDSGAADVSNMPDSAFSTFLAHRDPQNNIGSKEGKVASEADLGKSVDKFAVQEGGQAAGEQRLAERNFGGLAANGENDLSRRGVTSARVADDDIDGISSSVGLGFDRSAESMPMSVELANKPGSVENWAIEKSDSKKLWDRAADPKGQTSFWGDNQKADSYTSDFESPKSEVAAWELRIAEADRKPVEATDVEQVLAQTEEVWQELGVRRLERFGDVVESQGRHGDSEEWSKLDSTKSATTTVASGGSITLGGIRLNRETKSESESSTLMMTVTPRVIIPEGEEEPLGVGQLAPSPAIALRDRVELKKDANPSAPKQPIALDEQSAAAEAFSTFSLNVSDVSFKLAQAALSQSQWPEPAKIRIEEFVNALDYHDPLPSGDQKIACRVEQAIHPFMMQRNLLRVSMRTAAAGRSQNTPLRLTLLLDNSGSMERPDRRQAVLRAFQTLTQQLKATDQITLISFASSPRLLADKVPGNQGETLLKLIEELPSEGGTNIESALKLAREKAAEQQVAGAQNRIVLLTDGAVNLGDASPENLAKQVTQMRDAGIAFDAAGISAQDLNDEVLEALTRQGDGRYYLLDSAESASESFAAQIAGSLRPSAQNVKVQVEFNPQRVGRYKLLGYEKHRLNKEDFRNDQVDAAEMAAAEAGVAVYQYEIKPKGSGDVGSVSVRFRDLSTGQMVERRWPILYESNMPRLEQSQPSMQLAAAAALFAAKLAGGPLADSVDLAQLQKTIAKLPDQFASQPRVQQLRAMIEQAIAIQ